MNSGAYLLVFLALAPIAMSIRVKEKKQVNLKIYLGLVILVYVLIVTLFFYQSLFLFIPLIAFYTYLAIQSDGLQGSPQNKHDNWSAKSVATYEKLKQKYPQYSIYIDESLALDEFARYKLEYSYSKQEISVLQQKFSAGPTDIKKGAYGVLVWYLDSLGKLIIPIRTS